MAYKFQLGAAKLAGSVESTGAIDGAVISGSAVEADFADLVIAAVANGDIPGSKLAIADAKILIGDSANGHAQEFALSGDVAMTAGGAVTIQAAAVTNDMLSGSIANAKLANSTISGKALGTSLDALTSANGISMSSYNGSAAVSDIAIQRSGSLHALKLTSDGIAVLLSGSTGLAIDGGGLKLNAVPNASLASASVSFGGVELSLGGVDATPAFNLSDATAYPGDSSLVVAGALNVGSITSGFGAINNGASAITTTGTGSFGKMVVSGDLSVAGALTYIDTTNLRVSDALVTFSSGTSDFGAGRGFEIGEGSAAEGNFKTAVEDFGAGNINHFASSLALSSSAYYGDGSNLSGVSATNASQIQFGVGTMTAAGNIVEKLTLVDTANGAFTGTLPSIAAGDAGTMYVIKDKQGSCGTNACVIDASGSQVIDGVASVTLESGYAAITLFVIDDGGTAKWVIV